MILLWSKSPLIGSRLITWGLDEPSSHFAIAFFAHREGSAPIIESRLDSGCDLRWFGDFLEVNEVVHALEVDIPSGEVEANAFHSMSKSLRGRKYDKNGVLFWAWIGFKRKFFGSKLPESNRWNQKEQYFCVEVLTALPPEVLEVLGLDLTEHNWAMTSPEMAYNILKECQAVRDVTEEMKLVDKAITKG